jgi:uncharacterized protein YdiU (UPF0061 family)
MTIFFRKLADVRLSALPESTAELLEPLEVAFYDPRAVDSDHRERLRAWIGRYRTRVLEEPTSDEERRMRMNRVNPKFVLRNYLAQLAIDRAEQGDAAAVLELLEVLRRPFDEQPGKDGYAEKRPEWARNRAGCSMLSCSS